MLKSAAYMLVGAVLSAMVGTAFAVVGTAPGTGPSLIDGAWLNALAGGQNRAYIYGITAAGTNQATATQLTGGYAQYEVDTASASTGVALPACLQGSVLNVYNNGLQTLSIYPQIANNPVTTAQDTINNGTSFSGGLATHTLAIFSCAKNGVWAAK
jgi:hypothetical protein